jgi:hypothetical protein
MKSDEKLTGLLGGIDSVIDCFSDGSIDLYVDSELTDYINGGAALFYSYNFRKLVIRKCSLDEEYDITVEIYEFDTSENAFGIYSFDTDGDHPQIGHDATYAYGLLRFWKGVYFVRIFASYENDAIKNSIFDLGRQIANNIEQLGSKPELLSKIPEENVIDDRVHYFHEEICLNNIYYIGDENPLNLNANTNAVTYEYDLKGQVSRVILVRYEQPRYAEAAAAKFLRTHREQYIGDASVSNNETKIIRYDENKKYLCVKQIGKYLIVILEADSEDSCCRILDVQEALL